MSTFDEVLAAVRDLLQRDGRVAYRVLKRRFSIDDEYIEDLKADLIDAKRIAIDEEGKVLVWVGENSPASSVQVPESKQVQGPRSQVQSQEGQPLSPNSQPPSAERRQLTVLFCDLVGSTALSAQLDPEELRAVVQQYQQTCAEVIQRHEGYIAQYLGDGLLVYFGYPTAHEDDARRAVRTGLEIISAIGNQVPSPLAGEGQGEGATDKHLHVRIGIHTGLVVVGEIGSSEKREMLALGETPNIAARVQGQAQPDEVLISAATHRLVEGLFDTEDRGQPELKGAATPLTLYRVLKESDAHSRFDVVVRKGLTPLIGREHEIGLLRERWERVKDGTGQVVLLSGEPGIGKSRLVEALKETVEDEGTRFLELRCSPYTQNSALAPVIEHLQRVLQFQPTDSPDEKLQKLVVGAQHAAPLPADVISLLAALLSLPAPRSELPALSPQKQKEKTYEVLVAWLCAEAKQQAVTYAWEDLHWADPSTLELLTLFLQQVPTTRLFTVLMFRPEFTPPWGAHSYLSQLSLSRLGRTHVETMVEKVTGGQALPAEILQQIVSKTDGVPLFVEELTKSVLEQNVGAYSNTPLLGIPATLQDALMARLDRLGPAKEIAQLGATLGREFNYGLLAAVSPLNEDILQQGLKQLVDAELVYQSGLPPQARYLFKHALVQDTAYQSLLKSRRQQLHQHVARVLEEQFLQTVETQPELVAHHYTEAGLAAQAIPYWQKAGERAIQHSAYAEAISHLNKGLELVMTLPETPERVQQELRLQVTLGTPMIATKGYFPEVEKVYRRTLELCRSVGETPQLFSVLGGLLSFYGMRGELQTGHALAEQRMRLAQSVQDPAFLLDAYRTLGMSFFWLGKFGSARAHVEQSIALYDSRQNSSHSFLLLQEPKMHCLSFTAWALWFLGYPDQALAKMSHALALALEHPDSYSQAWALLVSSEIHEHRQEAQLTLERAGASITLATKLGFPSVLTMGMIMRGWAIARQGQEEEGIAQLRQGITAWQTMGVELQKPHSLALLAEAYEKAGRVEEGILVLVEALGVISKTGERFYEAEVYRIKGELTLQKFQVSGSTFQVQPNPQPLAPNTWAVVQEAEGCFRKAIAIAQKQQAKSLELRATKSLARLWQTQGKSADAHKLLSEVYHWFTEGFDTKDLQEAKELIESLSH